MKASFKNGVKSDATLSLIALFGVTTVFD